MKKDRVLETGLGCRDEWSSLGGLQVASGKWQVVGLAVMTGSQEREKAGNQNRRDCHADDNNGQEENGDNTLLKSEQTPNSLLFTPRSRGG